MDEKLPPLDLEATIVVRLEPVMAVVSLVAALVVVVGCAFAAWLTFQLGQRDQTWMGAALAVVFGFGVLLGAQSAALGGWLLATQSQPVLTITPAGILDRRLAPRLIPWNAITSMVQAWTRGFVPYRVGARLRIDRQVFKDVPLAWPHRFLSFDKVLPVRAVNVSAAATNIDARSLYAVVDAYWKAHRNKKEPINV